MAEGLSRFNNPELNKAQEPPPDTAESLREQIRQHEFIDQHRGILDRATTDLLNRGDENSLAALKQLEQRVQQGNVKQGEIATAVNADRDAMKWQNEVSTYGTGFLKAATLFLPGKGKIPWIAAGTVHALDQIKIAPDVSAGEVAVDGLLGFGKGAGLKIMMDKVGGTTWRTWEKGLVIGGAGGALETGMHRENWLTKEGNFDLLGGLGRTTQSTMLGAGTGAATFAVGHKLFKGLSATTGGALERSGLASNMGVGFSFGVTGGFTGEAMNQIKKGEFDPVQLAVRSLVQGGVDMLAGGTGYKAGRFYMPETPAVHPVFEEKQGPSLMSQIKGASERLFTPSEKNGDAQFSGKTRRRGDGRDSEDGDQGGDWQSQLSRYAKEKGWGTPEDQGGKGEKKGTGAEEEVTPVDESATRRVETDESAGKVEKVEKVEKIEKVEKVEKNTPTNTELDQGQAALQERLDALAMEGKLNRLKGMGAMKLYQKLPGELQQANGGEPIPDLELRVIRDNTRYNDLPDMIASAIAKAEAARKPATVTGTDEIVSGSGAKTTESGDRYSDLLRRGAGEGEPLNTLERMELSQIHKGRTEALEETLSLEDRLEATRRDIEAKKQTAPEEVRTEPKDEVVDPNDELPNAGLDRTAGLTNDAKVISMPDIDVVRETGGMFGTSYTQGNRLTRRAVNDAYLALMGEGEVQAQAVANLRKTAVDHPELKPALEAIAANHPEIDPIVKQALDGVVAPEPQPEQITLKDIVTKRPDELAGLVQQGIDLAARAAKGEAGAQDKLNEFALRSTDGSDPANPVFDIQDGMMKVAKAHPELGRSIYEAYQDTLSNRQLVEFGVRFAREAARGDADAAKLLNELATMHNHEEVKRGMLDAARTNFEISDVVYDRYKDALSIEDKFFFGSKYMTDAMNGGQPEMDRLIQFARDNPEPEVLNGLRWFTDLNPQYKDVFAKGFGQLEAPPSDLNMITEAGKLIDARMKVLLGEEAESTSNLSFMNELTNALAARTWSGQPYAEAQADIIRNLDLLARMKGIEDTSFIKQAVEQAPWPTDLATLEEANKLFDTEVATREAAKTGAEKPEAANPLQFIREINAAMQQRVNQGMRVDEAAAAVKQNLDRLAQSKGLENADYLNDHIAEAAVPSMSDAEDKVSKLGVDVLDMQIADAKLKEAGSERSALPDGEQFIRALWAEMMTYAAAGKQFQPLLDRVRARMEVQAALKGQKDANDLLPFMAEAGTFGHESGTRPGTGNLEVSVSPENQVDVMQRIGDFRQIVQNSRLPQDAEFQGTALERFNQWFEHQMNVRRDLFDWLNNNRDLWDYARAYAAKTEYSPIAAMIDSYPHIDSRYLTDFPSYNHQLFDPKVPRPEPRPEEVATNPDETARTEPEVQFNPTVEQAVQDMNSGDKALQIEGAGQSQYLTNPRARGVEQFSRWRQIVTAYADELPPRMKAVSDLFKRPEVAAIPDDVLMEFLSTNRAQVQFRKGGWSSNDDVFMARVADLNKAIDAFKTADMKDPTKADQPGMAEKTEAATALGIKLAAAFADNRPLLTDVLFKINDESPFRTQYKELLSLMLENPGNAGHIKAVLDAFKAIQDVQQKYLPRAPKSRPGEPRPPRVELTAEQNQQMLAEKEAIVAQAQDQALQSQPSNPSRLMELIHNLAYGKGERDQTPFKPRPPRK